MIKSLTELHTLSDKEEVKAWFADTVYEGSILIELVIDQLKEEVLLITSCPTESSNRYQYRFRKPIFCNTKDLQLGQFLHNKLTISDLKGRIEYNCSSERGTYDLERVQLKTYPEYFTIHLKCGDSDRNLDFKFLTVLTQEKLGQYQKKDEGGKIVDLVTQQEIEFDKPFE
jgi:hypothetical protein